MEFGCIAIMPLLAGLTRGAWCAVVVLSGIILMLLEGVVRACAGRGACMCRHCRLSTFIHYVKVLSEHKSGQKLKLVFG